MKKSTLWAASLAVLLGSSGVVSAQLVDITRPGDPIVAVSGTNDADGNAGAPPAAESEINAINDVGQKYLNFLDLESGFAVTPSANPGKLPVTGLRFYSANDAVERDPASYRLSGSNDSLTGPWTLISEGALTLPAERNAGGTTVAIPPEGNLAAVNQTVLFANPNSYTHLQLVFPTLKDAAAANSMQIAEVEFLVPEPSSIVLSLLSLLGLVGVARRR